MSIIETKRIYDEAAPTDGVRILVDRLWPRGVSKDKADLDHWCKDVAPTPGLRQWFDHRQDRLSEFKEKYLLELKSNPAVPDILDNIGMRKATLLYGARDPKVNHAIILAEFLKKAQIKKPAKG
jgi:uncharacterized protein YeaO (DUF488 family)